MGDMGHTLYWLCVGHIDQHWVILANNQQSWNGILKNGRLCWLLSQRSDGNSTRQRCWTSADELEIPCSPLEQCAHSDTTARNHAGLCIRCQWSCSSRGVTWSATPTEVVRYRASVVLRALRCPSPASSGSNFWLNDYVIVMIVNHFYHRMPSCAHLDRERINKRKPYSHLVLRRVYMLSFHNKCVNHGSCGP